MADKTIFERLLSSCFNVKPVGDVLILTILFIWPPFVTWFRHLLFKSEVELSTNASTFVSIYRLDATL